MKYNEVIAKMPASASLSSTFGNPGEGGYSEIWRAPDGRRWMVSNGSYLAFAPFAWTLQQIEEAAPYVDIQVISEYGLEQKLSAPVRCF